MTTDEEILKADCDCRGEDTDSLFGGIVHSDDCMRKRLLLARQDEAKRIFALADGESNDKDSPVRKVSKHSGIDTRTIKAVVAALKKECGVDDK